ARRLTTAGWRPRSPGVVSLHSVPRSASDQFARPKPIALNNLHTQPHVILPTSLSDFAHERSRADTHRGMSTPPQPLTTTVAVIGAGRLGGVLANALKHAGFVVTGPLRREDAVPACDIALLCVPDA